MAPADRSEREQARERLARLVESPSESRSLLPAVVGMLDSDDRHLRLSAAFGVCLVATATPDLLDYLVRRLVDRLHDDEARAEVVFAFEYLTTQFPESVDETLQEIREESDREPLAYTRSGGFRRSNIYSPSMGRPDVGRTRIAGDGQSPGPRQVYSDDADQAAERRRRERDEQAERDDSDSRRPAASDSEATDGETGESAGGDGPDGESDDEAEPTLELPSEVLAALLDNGVFDDVRIRSRHERRVYGVAFRVLGIVRGSERATSLRVFHSPGSHRRDFVDDLSTALRAWQSIDHEHVLEVLDWGRDPRPWAAVAYADETLAARERLEPPVALWNAIRLARALSALHTNDVVHGGIDPNSIAYSEYTVDGVRRQSPQLDNVGLIDPFRFAFDPSAYLDPRYAAPEYYDPSFGTIDHATDVYQLGAVVYRLFTGRPPYDADAGEIRAHVLRGQPTPPSRLVETVPAIVDQIVSKAMARQKLTRYENVEQLEQDLLRARKQVRNDG